MAPFLSHLVVGERVWQVMADSIRIEPGVAASENGFGSFLFGCLAADVDKFCEGLEQATTHMMAKDPAGTYVWRRSQLFLERQADVLRAPLGALTYHEQWFVMGYLCHLATDEITARQAGAMNRKQVAAGGSLPNIDALLTVLDARVWSTASDPESLRAALTTAPMPDGTLVFAPQECLAAMHRSILPQIGAGGGLEPYLSMVRNQWIWLRFGGGGAAAGDLAAVERDLQAYRRRIAADMPAAEDWVNGLQVQEYVKEASSHSLQRIEELLGRERVP
jgi:hypothetical protein